jgi:WD40 repeat protein
MQSVTPLKALASSSLSLPSGSYIYSIVPLCKSDSLAVISSDDSLRVFNRESLQLDSGGVLSNIHEGVTCVKHFGGDAGPVITAGRDGFVRTWDLRMGGDKKCGEVQTGPPQENMLSQQRSINMLIQVLIQPYCL